MKKDEAFSKDLVNTVNKNAIDEKLVLNENKQKSNLKPSKDYTLLEQPQSVEFSVMPVKNLSKEEQELENAMIKELEDFKNQKLDTFMHIQGMRSNQVKLLLYKSDNFFEMNKEKEFYEADREDNNNNLQSDQLKKLNSKYLESEEIDLNTNKQTKKTKELILLMHDNLHQEKPSDLEQPETDSRKLNSSDEDQFLKDRKIILNVEELQRQHMGSDKHVSEGNLDPKNLEEMDSAYRELQRRHPYIINDGMINKVPYCSNTGWFCCGEINEKSDLEKLGIGMVCYFKLLKAFIVCFFLICLINFPLYYFYYINENSKPIVNYRDALYKLTIGNIASSVYNCLYIPKGKMDTAINTNMSYHFDFNCYDTNITSIVGFGIAPNSDKEAEDMSLCLGFSTSKTLWLSPQCDITNYITQQAMPSCLNKFKCEFDLDLSYFKSNCKYFNTTNNIYLKYECHDNFIQLGLFGGRTKQMDRGLFAFIIVSIDLASVFVILVCMFIISHSQKNNEQQFKENYYLISDYTLHLKDLNIPMRNFYLELNDIIKHFNSVILHSEKILPTGSRDNSNSNIKISENKKFEIYNDIANFINVSKVEKTVIYDINYPIFTTEKLEDIIDYNENKMKKLKYEHELTILEHETESQEDVTKKYFKLALNKQINACNDRMTKIFKNMKSRDDLHNVEELYITFRNQKIANFYYDSYKKNRCVRCCYIFCCNYKKIKHLYFKNKWLNLTFTKDEPTNINWQNLNYHPFKKCLRSTVSIFIAVFLILISFVVVISSKYSQDAVSLKYNSRIDCDYISTSVDLMKSEFSKNPVASRNNVFTHCFCYEYFQTYYYTATVNYLIPDTNLKPCEQWMSSFIEYNSVFIVISILVPILGSILILLMKWLSYFEKNKTMTSQLTSSMWKMFLLQFINTGLVIVLVNIYIGPVKSWWKDFPMFTGSYEDFDPSWYSDVGTTINFTMFINVFVPHLSAFMGVLLKFCKRCCDGGCSGGKRTKKTNRKEYLDLYTGPYFGIDIRYAQLLTFIFVSLLYSSGIPTLYICVFLYLIFTYFLDKYLILRFYRTPPKFDLSIIKVFNIFIFFALILHLIFAIWVYGNPSLLTGQDTSLKVIQDLIKNLLTNTDPLFDQVKFRVTTSHNILCLLFLILLILIVVLRFTLFSFLSLFCTKEKRDGHVESKNLELGLAIHMRSLNTSYELRKIQFMRMLKTIQTSQISNPSMTNITSKGIRTNLTDYKFLKNYFLTGINYDREILEYKLRKYGKDEFPGLLEKNCDNDIKNYVKKFEFEEKEILTGDFSYNIANIPEYEMAAYYEYLQSIPK